MNVPSLKNDFLSVLSTQDTPHGIWKEARNREVEQHVNLVVFNEIFVKKLVNWMLAEGPRTLNQTQAGMLQITIH